MPSKGRACRSGGTCVCCAFLSRLPRDALRRVQVQVGPGPANVVSTNRDRLCSSLSCSPSSGVVWWVVPKGYAGGAWLGGKQGCVGVGAHMRWLGHTLCAGGMQACVQVHCVPCGGGLCTVCTGGSKIVW